MTKRLILIRHAKSSWAEPEMEDIDRVLNARGRAAADAIGNWLRDQSYIPDEILCSTAARTRETCGRLALDAPVTHLDRLYLAGPDTMLNVVQGASGDTVAMIAHNPGIASLAGLLVGMAPPHGRFADFPTCATLVADLPIDDWKDARFNMADVINFITPRELTGT